jgi:hypothetical protein
MPLQLAPAQSNTVAHDSDGTSIQLIFNSSFGFDLSSEAVLSYFGLNLTGVFCQSTDSLSGWTQQNSTYSKKKFSFLPVYAR